ncbi:MAG TPA: phosphate acetyltransferase [Enteractinococcus helveticum]|uniref:Phosphate acetyltransferase n=1 Tax=Enteractinococcus helveticum TaxID=1837282 RepID=A0A921FNX9_9MICC|nr:phosphate acetyltransferase [Enteractinococcus helveticum]HJF14772.1 phosphate acetyltransferase [Enteractinococcus helveticum]
MAQGIYITTTTMRAGKTLVSMGLADALNRHTGRVGYFRPIVPGHDVDTDPMVQLMRETFELDEHSATGGVTDAYARAMITSGKQDELYAELVVAYEAMAANVNAVVIEGTDLVNGDTGFEREIDTDLALHFNAPVLAVVSAQGLTAQEASEAVELTRSNLRDAGSELLSIVVNRAEPALLEDMAKTIKPGTNQRKVYIIPELAELRYPTVGEVASALSLDWVAGSEQLDRDVSEVKAVSMEGGNFLQVLNDGALVIVSGDRSDAILATLAAARTADFPVPAGMILTNGIEPNPMIQRLYSDAPFPVFVSFSDTFTMARTVAAVPASLSAAQPRKTAAVLGAWNNHVDEDELLSRIELARPTAMTPVRFLHQLTARASADRKRIVLPEGQDPRILRAAEILRRRGVCDLTILGDVDAIQQTAAKLGVDLTGIELINPTESPNREPYAQAYAQARAHRGVKIDFAREMMLDAAYFGTMMVQQGDVDGMVSGAVNTTAHTIRPALEFVKTKPGTKIVSSVFFMLLPDRALVYGDCAVNTDPDAEQLADIAAASAATATQFGVEPRVAMLSYSTGDSGSGEAVDKVRQATQLVKTANPQLKVDGPLQYDAAVSASVAASKMPDSEVAGNASVFIFPDLNTGNNTYKAVQQSAGAVAVGPVLQGLNKPVNDLSRGTTVDDIVNTVAITAIQAQAN